MSTHRRNVPLAVVAIIAALTLAIVAITVGRRGPHGAASSNAAVAQYLVALHAGDRAQLADIADPDYRSEPELDPLIQRFGLGGLVVTATAVEDTASDAMKSATLRGTLNGAPFTDTIWLHRRGARWYVLIGRHPDATAEGKMSS